jgi:uncharacterized protein YcnI
MNRIVKSAAALGTGIALALGVPLAASAHVTVDPTQADPGSYTVITLKVPNESDTATTNRIEISLPSDTPFASVRYVPVPGWNVELAEQNDTVTSVIWTADPGSEIQAGELQLFPLSVGPVPDVGSLALPTEQGHSDGTTVSWSEEGKDAEHPAPVLYVNDAPAEGHDGPVVEPVETHDAAAADTTDVVARVLGIAGLVVGVVGLVVAFARRRPAGER